MEKRGRSVLESIKSHPVQALTLAAIFFGGTVGGVGRLEQKHQEEQNSAQVEALRKGGFRLEELVSKFKLEVQVSGGEKVILHIAQTHHANSMLNESPEEIQNVIESQKHIEELLLYMKEKGVANTVYNEGVTPESMEALNEIKTLIADNQKKFPDNTFSDSARIINYSSVIEQDVKETKNTDNEKNEANAYILYAMKCELEREYLQIKKEYGIFKKTGHADERYQKTFESFQRDGENIPRLIENIRGWAEKIGKNELLCNGRVYYILGAVNKMYAEDVINIRPVETNEARAETYAPYSLSDRVLSIPYEGKPTYRHEVREEAALDLIIRDNTKEKVIPLVYGVGHNFSKSVNEVNKKTGFVKFGLIKLTPEIKH